MKFVMREAAINAKVNTVEMLASFLYTQQTGEEGEADQKLLLISVYLQPYSVAEKQRLCFVVKFGIKIK